jgi:hypothetical protein
MAHTNQPDPHVQPGGEVLGHGVRAASAAVHHEITDIPLGGVTRAATISLVFIGLVMLAMWGAWGFFLSQAKASDPGKPAMAADDFGQRIPATPRLQSLPVNDLASYRAQQAAKLGGVAWVDQGAGTVRLPIDAAMRLIVDRADAFADQKAKAPETHSWAFPGAARSDLAGGDAEAVPPAAAPASGEHPPAHGAHGTEAAPPPHAAEPAAPAVPPQH